MAEVVHSGEAMFKRTNGSGSDVTGGGVSLEEMPPLFAGIRQSDPGSSIRTEDLFPLAAENPYLDGALSISRKCIERIDQALEKVSDDVVGSDIAVQQLQSWVQELFCCRKLSDGFAMLVTGIFNSIHTAADTLLNEPMLRALRKAMETIRERPYLNTETAADILDELEESGLEVESHVVTAFLDAMEPRE